MNEIQVLATHNSYHQEAPKELLDTLRTVDARLADSLVYSHSSLTDQLDFGIRGLEFDVFSDPDGGRFATPKAVGLLQLDPLGPELAAPGSKVLHIAEVDYLSSCPTLVSCLEEVSAWSDDHPEHLPIVIQLEAKDSFVPDVLNLGFVQPLPIDGPAFETIEAEIRSVFDDADLVLPGEVAAGGWPTLDEARGRVAFALDDHAAKRDLYRSLHPAVEDRLLFVDAAPTDPDAAFAIVNDPVTEQERIKELVADGLLVRTRADADTIEARSGDTARATAALASGAQIISTDYEVEDDRFPGYVVTLPGGLPARCNPVQAPARCDAAALEE